MAHGPGHSVVAEGVETECQRDYLRTLDCRSMQGCLFSRPLTGEAMTRYPGRRVVRAGTRAP